MNSLQITDIAGTNWVTDAGADVADLYFSTQDNGVWGLEGGSGLFSNADCCEGFHMEAPFETTNRDSVTIAYGTAGSGPGKKMADPGLVSPRDISTAIPGGTVDNFAEAFYLGPNRWMRTRWSRPASMGVTGNTAGIYVSTDNGNLWKRRFTLNVERRGVIQRTNIHLSADNVSAYLPARRVGVTGLVRLNNLFDPCVLDGPTAPGCSGGSSTVPTIGSADVITLPDGGSLARRATEFDWQSVFGVHPRDSRIIIAPDVVNEKVWVTRDAGVSWTEDVNLTRVASQGGRLKLDGTDYFKQITHISFDPYDDNRIFVGTRDAGVVCSPDGGATWRMLNRTEKIRYITGFFFFPSGAVRVSTYGRGMWRLQPSIADCQEGRTWTTVPQLPGGREALEPRPPLEQLEDDPPV